MRSQWLELSKVIVFHKYVFHFFFTKKKRFSTNFLIKKKILGKKDFSLKNIFYKLPKIIERILQFFHFFNIYIYIYIIIIIKNTIYILNFVKYCKNYINLIFVAEKSEILLYFQKQWLELSKVII